MQEESWMVRVFEWNSELVDGIRLKKLVEEKSLTRAVIEIHWYLLHETVPNPQIIITCVLIYLVKNWFAYAIEISWAFWVKK